MPNPKENTIKNVNLLLDPLKEPTLRHGCGCANAATDQNIRSALMGKLHPELLGSKLCRDVTTWRRGITQELSVPAARLIREMILADISCGVVCGQVHTGRVAAQIRLRRAPDRVRNEVIAVAELAHAKHLEIHAATLLKYAD